MNALLISLLVFGWVFGGALFGMLFLGRTLPQDHLNPDAKDVIKVSVAMIATLAALVLGLLTASAKNSLDDKRHEVMVAAAQLVLLDRTLVEYGPEAHEVRELLMQTVVARMNQVWPEDNAAMAPETIGRGDGIEFVQESILALTPKDDAQRWLQSTALQITRDISSARWAVFAQIGSGLEWPFLIVLVFWLALIFASFGLFAPRNATVLAALFVAALSVASSIYLILDMDQPYRGLFKISSSPLRSAVNQLED